MEVELMVTKRDDDNQPGEYRAICLRKVGRQSFAIGDAKKQIAMNHHMTKINDHIIDHHHKPETRGTLAS